jgi:O-antigen/teichoic acid export membrane protein
MKIKIFFHNFWRSDLIKSSFILIFMLGLFNLLNYFYQISMAKLLGPADYGILATLMSLVYIFGIPSEAIQTLISKHISQLNPHKNFGKMKSLLYSSLRKIAFLSSIFFLIFLLFALVFLSNYLKINFRLLALTGLIIFTSLLLPVTRGFLQGRKKFFLMGLNMVLDSTLKVFVAIILVIFGFKVYGAIGAVILSTFAAFFLSFGFIKEVIKSKIRYHKIKNDNKSNIISLFAIGAIVILYSIDIILARRFFNPELAGQYSFISLIGKAIIFTNLAIGKVMFPISSENRENKKKDRSLFKKALLLVGIISIIALIFYLILPEAIIFILSLGSTNYLAASNNLFILGLAFTLCSFSNIIVLYLLSKNKIKSVAPFFLLPIIEIIALYLFHDTLIEFSYTLMFSNMIMLLYCVYLILKNGKD